MYYFLHPAGKGLAFASQYDTLLQTTFGKPGDARPDVLRLYLQLHHIPAPYALLENTFQLEPGTCLIVRPERGIETRSWWRLPRHPEATLTENDGLEVVSAALQASIRRQRLADVPLGVFRSGGIDSPLITAITRQQTGSGLKAFTIGSPGWGQDESEAARRYAEYLGVDFHLHAANGEEALSTIPEAIAAQHEPFADFSILPALLVSRFARQGMTVALSGDGGDELSFGYMRASSRRRTARRSASRRSASSTGSRSSRTTRGRDPMCRNIWTLVNFEPKTTDDEVRASALQFVRKISGLCGPSKASEAVFRARA